MTGFKGRFPRLGHAGFDYQDSRDRFGHYGECCIHLWCFYFPYKEGLLTDEDAVKDLQEDLEDEDESEAKNLRDRLGMTCLHILAASSRDKRLNVFWEKMCFEISERSLQNTFNPSSTAMMG